MVDDCETRYREGQEISKLTDAVCDAVPKEVLAQIDFEAMTDLNEVIYAGVKRAFLGGRVFQVDETYRTRHAPAPDVFRLEHYTPTQVSN